MEAGQRVGAPTYYLAHLLIVRIKDVKSGQLSQHSLCDGPRTLVKRNNSILSPMKICDIGQKGHMYTRLKHTQTHTLQLTIMGQVLQVFCWFVKLGASFKRQLCY